MADMDTGGGNAVNAAWITERLILTGLAGMNIEDQIFPKRCGHMAGKEVIAAEEMAGKVRACAAVRDRLDKDFIINARTDVFAVEGLDEAIRRCNLYLEAGADLAFIDGIVLESRRARSRQGRQGAAVGESHGRGFRHEDRTDSDPRAGRDGSGHASPFQWPRSWSCTKRLTNFFTALKSSPTGTLPGQTQWLSSFEEYTDFVGLPEYKKMEDTFLPSKRIESKYRGETKIVK